MVELEEEERAPLLDMTDSSSREIPWENEAVPLVERLRLCQIILVFRCYTVRGCFGANCRPALVVSRLAHHIVTFLGCLGKKLLIGLPEI